MKILDANMILRYLINDNKTMAQHVEQILANSEVMILPEVMAEVVYVLNGVYHKSRVEIAEGLSEFLRLDNVVLHRKNVIPVALSLYAEHTLDFVDCLLAAYHLEYDDEICTFDKKLNRLIEHTKK